MIVMEVGSGGGLDERSGGGDESGDGCFSSYIWLSGYSRQ